MTKIEWTNETWNPIIGCNKISPGCDNCYAEKMAHRLKFNPKTVGKYYFITNNGKWTGEMHAFVDEFQKPLQWKNPRMIFVCSMGDLFHESVPFEWINRVFAVIASCQHHTFQILTKRPKRMKEYFDYINQESIKYHAREVRNISYAESRINVMLSDISNLKIKDRKFPFNNLWLGVTTENQEQANKRIPILLQIPAAIRFVSCEPMLSNIDLTRVSKLTGLGLKYINSLSGIEWYNDIDSNNYNNWYGKLDWVICGGESGPKARPMHPNWVKSLRDQCKNAEVPFFFKQWGEWTTSFMVPVDLSKVKNTSIDNTTYYKVGKKKAGRKLNGVEYNEFPNIN